MSNTILNEITRSIQVSDLTNDDLHEITRFINLKRLVLSSATQSLLRIGTPVTFEGYISGQKRNGEKRFVGKVVKVKRTKAVVKTNCGKELTVPFSMLEIV